jgi:hypothetical protein
VVYRGVLDNRRVGIAALLQATSLPFIVAATAIGMELGLMGTPEGSALIAAGLLSVLLFPLTAITLMRGSPDAVRRPAGPRPEAGRRGSLRRAGRQPEPRAPEDGADVRA